MKLFKQILSTVLILFVSVSTFAVDRAYYDGYFVSYIIDNTTTLFLRKNLLDPDSKEMAKWDKYWNDTVIQQSQGFLPAFPFMDFENSLLNYCVIQDLITYKQANAAIEKSKHVGGTTINGYNLLYLHAEVLWDLVLNKHITKEEAKNLLDASYKKAK